MTCPVMEAAARQVKLPFPFRVPPLEDIAAPLLHGPNRHKIQSFFSFFLTLPAALSSGTTRFTSATPRLWSPCAAFYSESSWRLFGHLSCSVSPPAGSTTTKTTTKGNSFTYSAQHLPPLLAKYLTNWTNFHDNNHKM